MSHTKGPWKLCSSSDALPHVILGADGFRIVEVVHYGFSDNSGEAQLANANLIAAAPEMLEALEMALIGLKQIEDPLVETSDALIEVRRAIKKARGEK